MPIGRRLLLSVAVLAVALTVGIVALGQPGPGRVLDRVGPFATLVPTPPVAAPADAPVVDFPLAIEQPEDDDAPAGGGGSGSGSGGSRTGAAPTVHGTIAEQLLALANQARAEEGVAPLAGHSGLDAVALAWSTQLAGSGAGLSHNPSYASQIPGSPSAVAENVAWINDGGRLTESQVAAQIHASWMGSAGHAANILNPRFTHLGVGVANSPQHGYYLTQNFAAY